MSKVQVWPTAAKFCTWETKNCSNCSKSFQNQKPTPQSGEGPCELDNAITESYLGDGLLDSEIAERLGWSASEGIPKLCPEYVSLFQSKLVKRMSKIIDKPAECAVS